MKIHADTIASEPPHALRVSDLRRILDSLPEEWTRGISSVRLTNSREQQSYAFFHPHGGCLTVFSRGSTREEALSAILIELAAHSLSINKKFGRALSKAETQRLYPIIRPYICELLPTMTPTRKPNAFPPFSRPSDQISSK